MENEDGRNRDNRGKSLLNGSSLSSLTGARASAKLQVEVRLPASSMAEALATIHKLGKTGNLQVNFAHGRALDLKWSNTVEQKPPDV